MAEPERQAPQTEDEQRPQHGGGDERTSEIADAEVARIGDDLDVPAAIDEVDKSSPHGKTPQH